MKQKLRVCHNCGATRRVRRGLCRSCRKRALGTGEPAPEVTERPPARPDLEPPRGRPWVHRGSGSG
jgi:NMD protein affecting ribosome stability and mRNA decay